MNYFKVFYNLGNVPKIKHLTFLVVYSMIKDVEIDATYNDSSRVQCERKLSGTVFVEALINCEL